MTSASEHAIQAHGLYKRFKTGRSHIEVLKRVDFDALHGDVTMVMGPSGSGKSTLVAALSGLLKPDEGKVCALGQDLWSLRQGKIDRFRLDHCGFIFQGFNLFSALTALQQVQIVLKFQGVPKAEARRRAAELGQAKAQIALLQVQVSTAKREYERLQGLISTNFVARQKVDQAQDAIRQAEASLEAQRAAIAPVAATRMTENLMPPEILARLKPEYVTPGVVFLCSEDAPTGCILTAGAGAFALSRIVETEGVYLGEGGLSVEEVRDNWSKITDPAGQQAYNAGGEQSGKFFRKMQGG